MKVTKYSPYNVRPIEAYASSISVVVGNSIGFHVSIKELTKYPVKMEIYKAQQLNFDQSKYGTPAELTYKQDFRKYISIKTDKSPLYSTTFPPHSYHTPEDASQNGCGWPVTTFWQVSNNTEPSVYFACFKYRRNVTYVIFVVRPKKSGLTSKIICQLSTNTYQAYNAWGGHSLYPKPISKGIVNPISLDRPCQLWDYILYEAPIINWLERNYTVEFCANFDLDSDNKLLENYNLFISCGHDEYWSKTMRERIEEFGVNGGNVMFLSGNTCYRPIEYLGRNRRLMKRVTLETGDWGFPEAFTTGVNWSAGQWKKPLLKRGYSIKEPEHWSLKGTNLRKGDLLGEKEGIIGFETDAAVYDCYGKTISPTPIDFLTVASAYLPEWDDWYGRAATFGLFRRDSKGVVMTAGTTGWGRGLLGDTGNVHKVTKNLIDKLQNTA